MEKPPVDGWGNWFASLGRKAYQPKSLLDETSVACQLDQTNLR